MAPQTGGSLRHPAPSQHPVKQEPPNDTTALAANEGAIDGRNETALERSDRNLIELLQEVRVVQTGVQVLFGFLLMAPLTNVFGHLNSRQHIEYYLAFALAAAAAFVLIAPTAYHRLLFRRGDKRYLVTTANRLTIAGLGAVGASMASATLFVTDVLFGFWPGIIAGATATIAGCALWGVLPLARRRELSRQTPPRVHSPHVPDSGTGR